MQIKQQTEMDALRTKQQTEMDEFIKSIEWNVRETDNTDSKGYKLIKIKGTVHSQVLNPDGKTTRAIKPYLIISIV